MYPTRNIRDDFLVDLDVAVRREVRRVRQLATYSSSSGVAFASASVAPATALASDPTATQTLCSNSLATDGDEQSEIAGSRLAASQDIRALRIDGDFQLVDPKIRSCDSLGEL